MSYTLRGLLAAEGNCGGTRTASDIRYLVIHYTGNDGDTAANNAAYYQNSVVEASAHYFVDDTTVYRSVPDLRIAWAVGGKKYASCSESGGGKLYWWNAEERRWEHPGVKMELNVTVKAWMRCPDIPESLSWNREGDK